MKILVLAYVAFVVLEVALCAPNSLVLTTIPPLPGQLVPIVPTISQEVKEGTEDSRPVPIIYQFDINSNISNRFAKTVVTSKVKNAESNSQEATFTVITPDKAFISEFIMDIDDKQYKAYVKEKEEAKQIYDAAVQQGLSAGHVAVSARDSNRFTVSINIEPEKKAIFYLTYEELLERRNDQYELVLNVHPGQVVKDLNIEVYINESKPLKFVRTPSLRSGNEVSKNNEKLDPVTDIEMNSTSALVKFTPSKEQQINFAKELGVKENEGLSGQFVVQYDVERDPRGEVLLKDGYFVHFFAPDDQKPLPKHVVFVLDTSGSMYGNKIKQLREAMTSILDDLKEEDSFHIIEFETNVFVWDVENNNRILVNMSNYQNPIEEIKSQNYPLGIQATKENIVKGKNVINALTENSLTNILASLETALHLIDLNVGKVKESKTVKQPIVVFLTDGDPTIGIQDTNEITRIITNLNKDVPIFALSFGDGADKNFLRKLSLSNHGFSRHIYEAADASLQLQEFYKQISSPLLSDINFKYVDDVKEVTRNIFPIYFRGSELVTAGKLEKPIENARFCTIHAVNVNGSVDISPVVQEPVSSLERLWAYLTIKRKLEERDLVENKTQLTKEALDLALKYSFVTEVSSLVVVKPNATSAVGTEDASHVNAMHFSAPGAAGFPSGMPALYGPPPPMAPQYYRPGTPLIVGGTPQFSYNSLSARAPVLDSDADFDTLILPSTSVQPILRSYIKTALPWLFSATGPHGQTIVVNGTTLDIGEHEYFPTTDPCTGTPENSTEIGNCSLLNNCVEVFSLLTDLQTYEKFHCVVNNKYAGVCCPNRSPVP